MEYATSNILWINTSTTLTTHQCIISNHSTIPVDCDMLASTKLSLEHTTEVKGEVKGYHINDGFYSFNKSLKKIGIHTWKPDTP